MFAAETDWCWRMVRAGWKILYYPGAAIVHYGGASQSSASTAMYLQQLKSIRSFILKREGYLCAALSNWCLAVGQVVRLLGWAAAWVCSSRRQQARERVALAIVALSLHLGLSRVSLNDNGP
jgi:GT2 family glycosyltransferase